MFPTSPRVVHLADYQPKRSKVENYPGDKTVNSQQLVSATIVSLQNTATCFASIEIDELSALTPLAQRQLVMAHVREQLAIEFGALRITENERTYLVSHRNIEELIGAMLRVQYHVQQSTVEEYASVNLTKVCGGLHITWGVGNTAQLAESERVKQRQRKRFRKDL